MKVAFITVGAYMEQEDYSKANLTGTEYQVFGLSKALTKKGHKVYIFRRWFESAVEEIDKVHIISYESINGSSIKTTYEKLKFSYKVSKYLKKHNFDILIFLDPFTSFFCLNFKIPKITITHNIIPYDLLPEDYKSKSNKLKNFFLEYAYNRLFKKSEVIVAINTTIKRYLKIKGFKTKLIPNGININEYNPTYIDKNYILFGGRLVKNKNVDQLIKVYSTLDAEIKKYYKLIIVGFGPEEGNLKKLIQKYEIKANVEIIPWLNSKNFIKLMSEVSFIVIPSSYETFGIVTIEAMALGKPVIVTNTDGSRDIVWDKFNGFIFEKDNLNQLKTLMELLIKNKDIRNKIGDNARKTVEHSYAMNKICNSYEQLFYDIIK